MAESVNTGGGNSTGAEAAGAVQTEFKVPDGKVLIDSAEHERFRQNTERVRGMQSFYETASKTGFKKAEDFDKHAKFQARLKELGITPEQLMAAQAEDQTANTEGAAVDFAALDKRYLTPEQVKAMLAEERTAGDARGEHKIRMAQEAALVEKFTAELLGEKPSDWDKRAITAAVKEMLTEKRGLYSTDHPLHKDTWAPYDEKSLGSVFEEVRKLRALSAGEEMVKEGDAALKGKKLSTPAGSSPSTATKPPSKADQERRPGNLPPKAAVEADYRKRVAARGGGPVSSMGG